MRGFLLHWLIVAVALGVTAWLLPGVHVSSLAALAVAALVLGLVNAVIRPILTFLTLPLTIVTLGLFYLVVNGISFALAAFLTPGFRVDSLLWAILAAILLSISSGVVGWLVDKDS